jgi:steroid delta-isomerase-like uncharacterized protein
LTRRTAGRRIDLGSRGAIPRREAMSRPGTARLAAAAAGVLALVAGAISLRRRRHGRGGRMDSKEIARRLAEDPWRGKLNDVLRLVGDDYVGYVAGSPEPLRGRDGFREFVTMYLTAFPDGAITVDDQIAEGDFVATRWTGRGTNTGDFMGIPATGRQVTVEGITYERIVDGQAREGWIIWDTFAMMQQLGAVPETMPARTT